MNKRGFTLIELLVTIAIIGLLSSIVFASISSARDKANSTKAKVQGKEIEKAIELTRLSNGVFPVNTSVTPIKDLPSENETKVAIDNVIPIIPEIALSVSDGEPNDYYYISDGSVATDDNGELYSCGFDSGPDSHLLFYKDTSINYMDVLNVEDPDDDILKNIVFWHYQNPPNPWVPPAMADGYLKVQNIYPYDDGRDYGVYVPTWNDSDNKSHVYTCIE